MVVQHGQALGEDLLAVLREEPGTPGAEARAGALPATARAAVSRADGVLADDDVQLSLFVLHALHYQGVDGVDDRWESDPELLRAREVLSGALEVVGGRGYAMSSPTARRAREAAFLPVQSPSQSQLRWELDRLGVSA